MQTESEKISTLLFEPRYIGQKTDALANSATSLLFVKKEFLLSKI
jgi:hypothetical protein